MLGGTLAGRLHQAPPAPVRHRLTVADPYRSGGQALDWLRGNLQAASMRGVGRDLPRDLRDFYAGQGYRFLGICDLDTYTWVEEYQSRTLTGVPMVSATYPFGSLLAIGVDHWLPASSLQEAIDWIEAAGGLPILAAPNAPERPVSDADALGLHRLFALEVYDARLDATNPAAADATTLWDRLLSRGEHVFAFAGDDLLTLADPTSRARAWIEVLAPSPDLDSLTSALRQGAFYASTGPGFRALSVDDRTIRVETSEDDAIRFIGRGGRLLSTVDGKHAAYTVRGDEGYVRVELTAQDGGRAWSQPFWLS
jgi:hypothetical protein